MTDPRHFGEAMILYRMRLPYVKEILNNRAPQNGIIPQDWKGLVEAGLQLQWLI